MARSTSSDAGETGPTKPRKPRARKPATGKTTTRSASPVNGLSPELRLTGDRLIVRLPGNGERKTSGGLLIPATAMPAPKRLAWGDVRLVGPDVRVADAGDQVLFLPSSALEVELDGEDYVLLRERDVQAVSTEPAKAATRTTGQYL